MGAAALDLVARIDRPLGPDERLRADIATLAGGGVAATAAVAVARLGVPVAFVGTVGDDDASALIRMGLEREGVDVTALRSIPGKPAMSPILVDRSTGHRAIAAYYLDEAPVLSDVALELCAAADWVHVDHLGWRSVRALRAAGVTTPISLDHGNPTPDLDLALVDLYAPTEARLLERFPGMDLLGAMSAALEAGPRIVAVTRGSEGACVATRDDEAVEIACYPSVNVEVVSTLGAGDVFHGALLAALVHGHEPDHAVLVATHVAAMSCRALDGRSAIPTLDELEAFSPGLWSAGA